MTAQPADLYERLTALRKDLTACQGKVTDALNILAELNLPRQNEVKCDACGLRFRGALSLAEHLHVSHDGPLPAHWLEAERLAGIAE